jgi:transposase
MIPFCFSPVVQGGIMLQVSILPEDISTIQRDRFYHPQPHIMMRMHTLALHHQGESAARIAQLLDRDPKTIRACLKKYRDGGLAAVYEYEKHKHESDLEVHGELIENELAKRPPQSAKEAGAVIEQLTGIKRSPTQIREFLKKRKSGV